MGEGLTIRWGGDILVPPAAIGAAREPASCFLRLPVTALMSSAFPTPPGDVSLRVSELPSDVAEMVERTQVEDPETLRRIILYGVTRLTIFETLLSKGWTPARDAAD